MPHYTKHKLNIDIDRLGKCYLDLKNHLGFRTDDKRNIDFNAICINRIPDDEKSITGGNVRGLYWTYPDSTNVEEQRLRPVREHKYTEICPEFKGTYVEGLASCKGFSLTANQPLYSAIANDFGLEEVFSKQIKFLGSSGDILIAISSSGDSENIINGVMTAKEMGIHTIGFSGFSGGKLSKLADTSIHINVDNYGVVEDAHMSLMHIICQIIANKKDIIFDCQNK